MAVTMPELLLAAESIPAAQLLAIKAINSEPWLDEVINHGLRAAGRRLERATEENGHDTPGS